MLTMTATLSDSLFDSGDKILNVNAQSHAVQSLDAFGHVVKNETHLEDSNKDNFRNFDMWNSGLVSQLPRSSESPIGTKKHGLPTKILDVPEHSWESNMRHMSLNTSPKGPGCTNNNNVFNYRDNHYHSSNERIDHGRPIATDIITHQLPLYHNNYPEASYVMPQPPPSSVMFQNPYDVAAYEQYLIFNYFRNVPPALGHHSYAYQKNQSAPDNESVAVFRSPVSVKKKNDRKLRPAKTLTKTENNVAALPLYAGNVPSSKNRIDTMKSTQKHTRRILSENTLSRTDTNDERRLRPILKQTTDRFLS